MIAPFRQDAAREKRALIRPGAAVAIIGLVLIAAVIGINALVDNYRDRLSLRGRDGKPLLVHLTIGGEMLTVPADLIRFRGERRGGTIDAVDLALHWPSLEGDGFASDDTSPAAPLVFLTLSARASEFDANARLATVYSRFFIGTPISGPAGLIGRSLASDSGYRGEVVFVTPDARFATRCLAEPTAEIPATCLRDVNIGAGLSMLYRFDKARLAEWQAMDGALQRLVLGFLASRS